MNAAIDVVVVVVVSKQRESSHDRRALPLQQQHLRRF
jgi:hypothetical protein